MPFARPTLTELRTRVVADIAGAMKLPALLRFSVEGAFARALAGAVAGLYGYLDWIAKQSNPATAEGAYLQAWGALKGVTPKPATEAYGSAMFAGSTGSVLPAGTLIVRPADGVSYVTLAAATVNVSGTVNAQIEASETGAAGNAAAGVALVLGSSVAGVASTGSVLLDVTGGADVEQEDAFRTRVLDAYQNPPEGGSRADYKRWATAVPGVTRAWVTPNGMGAGTVLVRFMMDDARAEYGGFPIGGNGVAAADPRAISASGDQLTVANAILPLQPVTALVWLAAPTPQAVNFTIQGLSQDTPSIRAAISAALARVLREQGEPGGVIYPNAFNGAVDGVPGVSRFAITAPAGPVVIGAGSLPTLGAVSYTS